MRENLKSGCPINLTLEVLGDRWSLLIIRDVMFGDRRHYRELWLQSEERISSNILADRLKTLVDRGILTKVDDPSHRQKAIYSLTEQGIALLPVLAQMAGWGATYLPVARELGIRGRRLADGGPTKWNALMEQLRERHLGRPGRAKRSKPGSVAERSAAGLHGARAGRRRGSADAPPKARVRGVKS